MTNEELCESIAGVISGYRNNEFGVYDAHHVKRWIEQFEVHERSIVLKETNKILKNNFITQKLFNNFIESAISSPKIAGNDKNSFWQNVSILEIQKNGDSQKELNELFCAQLKDEYEVINPINKASNEFIYLDDFIFSGNRLYNDLQTWLTEKAPSKCSITIITIGWYVYGQYNTENRLNKLLKNIDKNIDIKFRSFERFRLENRLSGINRSEVFWPTSCIESVDEIQSYLESKDYAPKFRVPNGIKNRVFSRTRREEYEKIILKYGIKILGFSRNNNKMVKPLGYHFFNEIGFGSTMFSFRNCPNNNPLVFWWGDPEAPAHRPFSKWYPLMQRNTYEN
ncbi:hypothetical protein [uncultured Psychromonas sp.]|uniref:phosphoribosyltransferase-like protein n=1 Tax=uncultured Psychromonas sp. TaxID=173974 RepID=UPI00260AD9BF|nr:hypothetical protein [uncultured Psychromonas sp.]